MLLNRWRDGLEIDLIEIAHEIHDVRVANIEGDSIIQSAEIDVDMASVDFPAQRDRLPVHSDFAHDTARFEIPGTSAFNQSPQRLECQFIRTGLLKQQPRYAARCIATSLDLAAIDVENFHECDGRLIPRRLDDYQLISADPGLRIADPNCFVTVRTPSFRPSVDNNKMVL